MMSVKNGRGNISNNRLKKSSNPVFPCPYCKTRMHEVKTVSHYNLPVNLEQCPSCGGLWFDSLELFRTKHSEVKKIDDIDISKFRENKLLDHSDLYCPKDNNQLKLFKDSNFPKSLQVESCTKCGGFWFNRGEFTQFKKHQKEKIGVKERVVSESDQKLEESIEKMFRTGSDSSNFETIGHLGSFLSTPMRHKNLGPAFSGIYPSGMSEEERKVNQVLGIIIVIVKIILALLLRKTGIRF